MSRLATVMPMAISCADCGCLVRRGVIAQGCARYPECCCRELVADADEPASS